MTKKQQICAKNIVSETTVGPKYKVLKLKEFGQVQLYGIINTFIYFLASLKIILDNKDKVRALSK